MSVEPAAAASDTAPEVQIDDLRPSLTAKAETARRLLPEFDQVSITVVDGTGTTSTRAQAGDVVTDLDRLQYSLGEGPCIDSIRGDVRVVAPHIQRDGRWCRYVSAAAELGLRAQLAAPLGRRGDGPMGALNLYSTTRGDIASVAPAIAQALAVQVAMVLDGSREVENLRRALATRETVGIAVGLLMAEYQLTQLAAFAVLEQRSSTSTLSIQDIAARMVADRSAAPATPAAHTPRGEHRVPDGSVRARSLPPQRESAPSEARGAIPVDADTWFQLTFVAPGGRTYEMILQAPSDLEAVRGADEALDAVERIGIHDYLLGDGLTVRPPARLHVTRVPAQQAVSGLGLVITDPDGTVTRR